MCFETSSSSSFTAFSFLCVSCFHSFPLSAGWSLQSKTKCWVFTEDTQLLVFKRLLLQSAQQVQALCNSCISPVTDNVLMWGSKSYLQYVLEWNYLLGDQNNLDAFCSSLCLQNTYCFLLCFLPQGEGHASQLLYSNLRKNIKDFSSGQAREINKPQGIYHMYPSWTYGSELLWAAVDQRTDGVRSEHKYSSVQYNVITSKWTPKMS